MRKNRKIIPMHDILPPFRRKISFWLRAFYLFLKTSRYFLLLVIAVIVLIIGSYFIIKSRGNNLKAQEQLMIFPTEFSGNWMNPEGVLYQDLKSNATFEEFNQENSAYPLEIIGGDFSEEGGNIEKEIDTSPMVSPTPSLEEEVNLNESIPENFENIQEEPTPMSSPSEEKQQLEEEQNLEVNQIQNKDSSIIFIEKIKKFFGEKIFAEEIINEEEREKTGENFLPPRILELSNFSIKGELLDIKDVNNVQLRLSLAGRGKAGDKLAIDYYYQNEWQKLATFNLGEEFSNALNNGYFLYALPLFRKWEDLENFKIRLVYLGSRDSIIFLDAAWLEIEYKNPQKIEEFSLEEIEKLPKIKVENLFKNRKKVFKANEKLEFEIDIDLLPKENLNSPQSPIPSIEDEDLFNFFYNAKDKILGFFDNLILKVFAKSPKIKVLKIEIFDPNREKIETVDLKVIEETKIKISKKEGFKPGKYTILTEVLVDNKIFVSEQEFLWGVLAINTNKSIYLPNEIAFIQMASLDESGHTLCDSNLKLEIITPGGELSSVPVKKSGECGPNNVTDKPDYFAYYQVNGTGIYQMKLTNLDSGYEIEDSFEVRGSVPFDVERIGPTRIYPPATYKMRFKIKANQDFVGEIIEQIPSSFEIKSSIPNSRFQTLGASKQIIWDVDWGAGKVYELFYQFDAPDISPYLYLLGPLEFRDKQQVTNFQEIRQWQISADAVAATDGTLVYGDTTNVGYLKIRDLTAESTFAAELNGPSSSGSNIVHVVIKAAPTRNEKMIGHLKVDGRLDIVKCTANGTGDTTACDDMTSGAEDFIAQWNNPGTTGTLDCDNTTPDSNVCYRAFDIAYEQLSGKAVVFYADNVASKIYYCTYDGSSWSHTCGSPGSSNEIDLSSYITGTPRWIAAKSRGERLTAYRTNQILVGVADSNNDFVVFIWDEGTISNINLATNNLSTYTPRSQTADVAWEEISGNAIAAWADDNATPQSRYKKYTSGSGWDSSDSQLFTQTAKGRWVMLASDPLSNRIMYVVAEAVDEYKAAVWKADGSTPSWTANTEDTAIETVQGRQASTAWERFTNQAWNAFNNAGTTADSYYEAWTGTFQTPARTEITTSDDALSCNVFPHFNSNYIMLFVEDVDCDLYAMPWTGSANGTAVADLETNLSSYGVACPNATAPTNGGIGQAYAFAYTPYSSWSRNWRWTDDITNQTPSSWLAAENTTPTNIPTAGKTLRLRFNFAELGGMNQTDARKRLQWATSTDGPWYDVDAQGGSGIWRYADCPAYSDDALITSTQLTGSTQTGPAWENGTAASSNGDHNALAVMEVEYCIQSNGAEGYTTYYFRAYDNDQQTPVFRQQTSNPATPCAGNTACSYPSLTTGVANNPPTVSNVQLNGQNNITLNAGTTVSISATATVSDPDGYSDISNVQAKIYRSGVSGAQNCTQDDNNCYAVSSCSLSNCSGNSCDATCTILMWFHADPTDSGSPWASEYWRAWIKATDSQGQSGENFSPVNAPDVNTLAAMELDLSSIGYGTVLPNQVSNQVAMKVTAIGNTAIDLQLSGTNLVWNSNTISVSQQKYSSINNFNYDTQGTALTTTPTCHELSIQKPTTHPSDQQEYVYWKLKVPTGKPAGGPYSGTAYFDVVVDSACP